MWIVSDQEERTKAIEAFKEGKKDVLVATDVASKGLDFPAIQHVVNYDMPEEIENYGKRICVWSCLLLKLPNNVSFSSRSSWLVEIVWFQSTELEELDDQEKLVLPPRSSTKAVVRGNTDHKDISLSQVINVSVLVQSISVRLA